MATGVSFLFRCPPSPAVSLGTMHPAMREELPQETPVARPPTRVKGGESAVGLRVFPFVDRYCMIQPSQEASGKGRIAREVTWSER